MRFHEEHQMQPERSGERGLALVIVMFMVMTMSLVGASLIFVSRTETLGSRNYQTVTQSRYAAEAGISAAANFLMPANGLYVAPSNAGADLIGAYDITQSPVRFGGNPVVLASTAAASNYPVAQVITDFINNSTGPLPAGQGFARYTATATLMAMRQMTDSLTGNQITLQTWQITGTGCTAQGDGTAACLGSSDGAGAASVQVSAVLETNDKPVFQYAAFATGNGCGSLSFSGGAYTDSYDSRIANSWNNPNSYGGDVGTNGNLTEGNNSTINGSLATPRSGVGNCSAGNVTAVSAGANVTGGITQLSQPVTYSTPPQPNPMPPTTATDFSKNGGCPAGIAGCSVSADGATIHPATAATVVTMGNVTMNAGAVIHLSAGTYVVNSLKFNGNASIVIDGPGPVVFKVAGVGQATPIDLSGGAVTNTSFDPTALQFYYGGTGTVKLTGGSDTSGLVVAPNSNVTLTGGGDFYGSVIAGTVSGTGGAVIHYDRALATKATTEGNPVLHQFTWSSY
jgi:hypothetical protein